MGIDLTRDWPPKQHAHAWQRVAFLAALRDSDEATIRAMAQLRGMGGDRRKPYMASPIPALISRIVADMLFGEEPRFLAADEADQDHLGEIITVNQLPAELHRAAVIASSEGEVWGRVIADPELAPTPIIDFHSRGAVLPEFRGRFLLRASVVSVFLGDKDQEVYRLIETHSPGQIESQLFKGNKDRIGTEVSLDSRPETAGTRPLVLTGIDRPLVVRIVNRVGRDYMAGESDYDGLENLFLAVNEALTITQQNMRLTGAKRLMVDRDFLDKEGKLQLADDVYVHSSGGIKKMGEGPGTKPFEQLEYSFEAAELTRWIDWMLDHTLTAAGISPASVGRGDLGGSLSGTALRLRMAHTLSEIAGKGRLWDAGIAELLRLAQLIDAKPVAQGGFGKAYADAESAPRVERGDGLPEDPREDAQVIAQLAGAEAISTEEKVRRLHPTWDDARVADEVARIDEMSTDPLAGFGV